MTSTEPRPDFLTDRPDDPLSEELLLQAVRDGSTAAFGILYTRYRSLAVSVAVRALPSGDASQAEDVAEVAFIRVLTALRNGKGPADGLRSYLTTTVRREAWRAQRRRRRQAEIVDLWAADEELATPSEADAEVAAGTRDLGGHVLLSEAFRGLSDRWRHVLWLTEVEGRKPADLAPILGVSAGSASALAYRARNGLISAYVDAYRRTDPGPGCQEIADRLGGYIAAGAPDEGFADVHDHLAGCRSCREITRGVDLMGTTLSGLAPFGLLTAGWWAKAAVAGKAGLVGKGAFAAFGARSLFGSGGGATGGGAGITGIAVAAAATVLVAGAAVGVGITRSDDPAPLASGPSSTTVVAGPSSAVRPPAPSGTGVLSATTTNSAPARRDASPAPATPAPSTTAPSTTAPVPKTPSTSTPVTSTPVTTTPVTTAPVTTAPATTSHPTTSVPVTEPPDPDLATLSGHVVRAHPEVADAVLPVAGVVVEVYDIGARRRGQAATGEDGRWTIEDVPPGRYLVVAIVPSRYRPATGPDTWGGGGTWITALGALELTGQNVDLVDLHLRDR